jgi:single-stranded-DNA-specific exonuclease RecJ
MEQSTSNQNLKELYGIDGIIADILISRGFDNEEKVKRYLSGGIHNLYDPFLLDGVREAAEKINGYITKGASILIYGDYDTDGICAVALLQLYLQSKGARVDRYIPEREEGYGINKEAVLYIKENYNPALMITVDCGITAKDEAEYIKSLGIDLIITDHHNSDGNLPETIIINPKICRYPFKDLCGAGIALKLVQALGGIEEAEKYIDIAAIATIADSVELTGENRDIAKAGLEKLNNNCRKGIKILCEVAAIGDKLNAYWLAYGIVPRINAAGRTGEAKKAVSLFTEDDEAVLKTLCESLNAANCERQRICGEILCDLTKKIRNEGVFYSHCIAVIDESGRDGVSGIVASKLCEIYQRPAFVFCPFNGFLKGSGRSIEGIDIFDMLCGMRELFERFGGHSAAAGVTLKKENFCEFVKRADKYISEKFDYALFNKKPRYDYDITDKRISADFIRQLELFEPCGQGNPKPRFLYRAKDIEAVPLKNYPQHISFKISETEITAFNFGRGVDILKGQNNLILEFSSSEFKGRIYDKGYLKEIETEAENAFEDKIISNYILQYGCKYDSLPDIKLYDTDNIKSVLNGNHFGTLIIVQSKEALKKLYEVCPEVKDLKLSVFFRGDGNNISRVALSPVPEINTEGYDTVIFYDVPAYGGFVASLKCREIYIPGSGASGILKAAKYDLNRSTFAAYYRMITDERAVKDGFEDFSSFYSRVRNIFGFLPLIQFTICFLVFKELGFFEISEGQIKIIRNIKKNLENSQLYKRLKAAQFHNEY